MKKKSNHHTLHPSRLPYSIWSLGLTYACFMFAFIPLMSTLLLYMSQHAAFLKIPEISINKTFAAFASLAFTVTLLGGIVCDRFGFKNSAVLGLWAGFIGMFIISTHIPNALYIGLGIFLAGNALCTPAIWSMVSMAYLKDDPNRDTGSTIFYIIFNLGGLLGVFFSGIIANHVGYQHLFRYYSFALLIAAIFLTICKVSNERFTFKEHIMKGFYILLSLSIIAAISTFLMIHDQVNTYLIFLLIPISIGYLLIHNQVQHSTHIQNRIYAFTILCLLAIFFATIYNMMFTILPLFAKYAMDLHLFGYLLNPNSISLFDSVYVIILGGVLSVLWHTLNQRNIHVSIITKFCLGILISGLAYLIMAYLISLHPHHTLSAYYLFLIFLCITLGEMLVIPTGIAMVDKLAPPNKDGFCMGIWKLMTSASAIAAGFLADLHPITKHMSLISINNHSIQTFGYTGATVTSVGILALLLLRKPIQKMLAT